MKYIIKNNTIIIIDRKKSRRIILNYNNNSNEMALNTFLSIKNIIDNNIIGEIYIININRYENSNIKIIDELIIKNPNIKIYSINILKYIDNIKNKNIIDISEIDRMLIIFTAKNIQDIYVYIKELENFEDLLLCLIK